MYRLRQLLTFWCGLVLLLIFTFFLLTIRMAYDDSIQPPFNFTPESPLIFVGGFPRSGTTLMRILLDVHSDIRCGPETQVIPLILSVREDVLTQLLKRYQPIGPKFDNAVSKIILSIIQENGPLAPRLCNKDPFAFLHMRSLALLFPNAKFVLMMRDGRAVVHSVFKNGIGLVGVRSNNVWELLTEWNKDSKNMVNQCNTVGPAHCMMVKYEDLVLQPEASIRRTLKFLNVPWSPRLLNHSAAISRNKKIILNKAEPSSKQVVKPISLTSLTQWATDKFLPLKFIHEASRNAPLLLELGYDVEHIPPNYG